MNNIDIEEVIGGLGIDITEWNNFSEKCDLHNIDQNIQMNIYIGMLIKSIQNALTNNFNMKLKEFNLTASQFDIIIFLILNENKEINQKDIEKRFNLKNPTVTGLLKRLELKGFIKRYTNKHDGRYKRIVLSNKSKSIKDSLYQEFKSHSDTFLRDISSEEKIAFIKTLMKFNEQIISINNENNRTEKAVHHSV